jgi:hypothetical protein
MSNQFNKNINEPLYGSTKDSSAFPAGSAKPGQNEPVGATTIPHTHGSGQTIGQKLDSAIHTGGQTSSTQATHTTGGFDNLHQKHPIWSDDATKTGSDVREGLGSQSHQPTFTQSHDKDSSYQTGLGSNLGANKDFTDTSTKVGSDQRENVGTYSTFTYPASTTGTSLSTTGLSHDYGTSSTYPASTTGTSLSQTYGTAGTSYTDSSHKVSDWTDKSKEGEHVSHHDVKHDETKTGEHKPSITEKIKEKAHHAVDKIKETFSQT